MTFNSFHVWYKYKAASQQLLDSWKEKRMTGFKLSWRIENENPPRLLIATISKVGRSVQTPGLGDSLVEPVDHKSRCTVIRTLGVNVLKKILWDPRRSKIRDF